MESETIAFEFFGKLGTKAKRLNLIFCNLFSVNKITNRGNKIVFYRRKTEILFSVMRDDVRELLPDSPRQTRVFRWQLARFAFSAGNSPDSRFSITLFLLS